MYQAKALGGGVCLFADRATDGEALAAVATLQ
jgi:hypothetical protein